MKIFDTLSGKKKTFVPRIPKHVDLFVCGPTVYDHSHIGHARTYIAMDAFAKYLRLIGYRVNYVQNITDIDDKIIARAKKRNENPKTLARLFEKEYLADMKMLSVNSVSHYARATDFIPEIIKQIETLIKKGYTYQTETGVYFEVKKFRDYGKLSRQALSKLRKATRIEQDETKKNSEDFVVWKIAKPGEPTWKSPWGLGRPGWHIEDTAITETLFGAQYDIHGGGRDLIFPHHESEIAQMEASSGKKPMVRYWMHTGFLTVGQEKMSKSLGNFITIKDALAKHSAYDFRLFFLAKHYRSPLVFDEKFIAQARAERTKIQEFLRLLREQKSLPASSKNTNVAKKIDTLQKKFFAALDDDFNTPKALAALFEIISYTHTLLSNNQLTKPQTKNIEIFFKQIDGIFGIIDWSALKTSATPLEVKILLKKREQLRKGKKWQEADVMREEILKLGYVVEDTSECPRVKKR